MARYSWAGFRRWLELMIGTAAALAAFGWLFGAFVVMARDADLREDVRRSEAVVDAAAYAPEAEDAEEAAEEARYEIYTEGDGPAPAWYDPDGPMAAEWYADAQHDAAITRDALQRTANYRQVTDCNADNGFADTEPVRGGAEQVKYLLDVPLDEEMQAYIYGLCQDAGVPFTLVIAVIEAESTYRADVISATNDYGLMQINVICHDWLRGELGIEDFLDQRDNIRAGVYILGGYYRLYGAESGTLVAYNMGQAAAEELFSRGIYETDYSRRVAGIRYRLETEGA